MNIKNWIDIRIPWAAATYRLIRDQRKAARWRFSKTPLGFVMIGVPGIAASRRDTGEMALLLELLKSADLFVDVGANCGLFTLAARHAGIKCIAIEPNLENMNALLANVKENQFDDIEVFPIALAAKISVLPLFGGGEGASLTKGWGGMLNTYSRLVAVNTIDNLILSRFQGRRLLVKIDVEGNEFDVLNGAVDALRSEPSPMWLIEHGFKENFSNGVNPRFYDVFDLFWRNGYRCITADNARREVAESDVKRWLANGDRDFGFLNYLFTR